MENASKQARRPFHRYGSVTIKTPPSVNGAWANVPGKGRVRTAEYRAWLKEAGWTIKAARIPKITGLVAIRIRAGVPSRKRDLDNIVKPLLDALTRFGVIEDDGLAHRITAEWSLGVETGQAEVAIRQFSAPEMRQKIVLAVSARHAARRAMHSAAQTAGSAA